MKIGRRCFLGFAMGGIAGTALSPIPWKLTDDISIWTQNWPWTPVPPKGARNYVSSTCTLCSAACGIQVRTVGQRLVKIEGLKGHPVNDGGICPLGSAGLQLLYGGGRIQAPMRRTEEKGSLPKKWSKGSWSGSVSELAAKLTQLRNAGNANKVGILSDDEAGSTVKMLERFLAAYGSSQMYYTASAQSSFELMRKIMTGTQGPVAFDFENSDVVLSLGAGLFDGWGSPVYIAQANSRWQDINAKIIQVEPRISNTAAKATKWIPIVPGKEAVFALAVAHELITQGSVSPNAKNSSGYDAFKSFVLQNYKPASVSEAIGVSEKVISKIAIDLVTAKHPVVVCGRGQEEVSAPMAEVMAVGALNMMLGNVNQPGGMWFMKPLKYMTWPDIEKDVIASKASISSAQNFLQLIPQIINAPKGEVLEVLFLYGANPVYTVPNTKEVKAALEKIPFIVSFSPYLDETTAQYADLVLPSHAELERFEDIPVQGHFPKHIVGLAKPVIEIFFDSQPVGDTILQITKKIGGSVEKSFPWETYEDCMMAVMGDKWETLVQQGWWTSSEPALENSSFSFVPAGKKTVSDLYTETKIVSVNDDYPLTLIPYDQINVVTGRIATPPFLVKTVSDKILKGNDIFVQINPKTARKYGVTEKNRVTVSTATGEVSVRIHISEEIMPDVIALPRGFGHTGYDKYIAGKGINYNSLIAPKVDFISLLDTAWETPAKLVKA